MFLILFNSMFFGVIGGSQEYAILGAIAGLSFGITLGNFLDMGYRYYQLQIFKETETNRDLMEKFHNFKEDGG